MNDLVHFIDELEQIGDITDLLFKCSELFPGQVVFSSSMGEEDQVITDFIFRNNIPIEIFTLDTGRLFPESLELLAQTEKKYQKRITIFFPDTIDTEKYVNTHGINAFYESVDLRKSCCQIRKVKPLKRALEGKAIWITGLRREQSENRQGLKRIEFDNAFNIVKINPLLEWNYPDVKKHIIDYSVPYNPLHDSGFLSIGCAPCTRSIQAGEDARSGRWWWESSKKECGLHENYFQKK